jgi:hypothetical protein
MIIEHAQMMAAAYYHTIGISRKKEFPLHQEKIDAMFKGWPRKKEDGSVWHYSLSHVNHPCTIWARTSIQNFNWLLDCTEALCDEFLDRWKNRQHSIRSIVDWMRQNPPNLPSDGQTPFAQAMPICYQSEDAIVAYRKYYAFKTTYMKLVWNKINNQPYWWIPEFVEQTVQEYVPNPVPEKKTRVKKAA